MYGDANSEFNFSIGWLKRFKERHEIKSYRRFGESGSIVMENIKDALPQIRAKLENFDWKDIYNMDKTGLSYYKVPLWIIGKFANPICFIDNLNCHYRANKKAWMTGLLFQDFVRWFDARMTGRKVLLIVDNCPAHPKNLGREINLEKINVLNAIHFINVAWNIDVKPKTIANCFRQCKIRSKEDMPLEQEISDVEGIHKLKEVISDLHYRNVMDVEQILNYQSENESLMESPTDEEIIQGVIDVPANDEQDPNGNSVLPYVSPKETFLAVDSLKSYLIQHEKNIPDLVYGILKVKDEIVFDSHAKKKQLTIDAYFSKE
ncbi:CENP-B homolog protein 2-like [Gossypium hirsutum]|uniref:CENP-B homolog protein 2-like n=1 Tax=Gossypium hirsutum TaxID=3635 RepID=A0A1U8L165_GOSHI|nr:CENP-B homolog protein 2-like [Gossypium hirsutum]